MDCFAFHLDKKQNRCFLQSVTSQPPATITVSVPATSANVGPGYDCLGLAVSVYNETKITQLEGTPRVEPHHDMVESIASFFFQLPEVEAAPFAFAWEITGDVPRSRGLGSSVTVRLGILMGLNGLCGSPLNQQRLFEICSEAEGHPDNVGPAVFGGFVLSREKEHFRFPVSNDLKVALLIPNFEVETAHARTALPESVPHRDATKNTANACALVASFASQSYERAGQFLEDFLHQPYRRHLVPGLFDIIDAGKNAGAYGGYLSGSGSTIACLASTETATAVANAMLESLRKHGHDGYVLVAAPDNQGAKILS